MRIEGEHKKLRNAREDFMDKVSTAITKRYGTTAIEDLNVQKMMRDHSMAKSVADVPFYVFRQKLEWKAEKYDKNIVKTRRFHPSL